MAESFRRAHAVQPVTALQSVTGTDAPLDAAEEPALPPPASPERAEARRPDVRLAQARVAGAELVRKYS